MFAGLRFTRDLRFKLSVRQRQTKGNQTYEDRFVSVKARSFDEAVRKLRGEFREYGQPYLNPDGFMVRWQFESVVDVYDTGEEFLDGRSVEVFSALKSRRIRPEFTWQPRSRRTSRSGGRPDP
jgi:hypothetical protein